MHTSVVEVFARCSQCNCKELHSHSRVQWPALPLGRPRGCVPPFFCFFFLLAPLALLLSPLLLFLLLPLPSPTFRAALSSLCHVRISSVPKHREAKARLSNEAEGRGRRTNSPSSSGSVKLFASHKARAKLNVIDLAISRSNTWVIYNSDRSIY